MTVWLALGAFAALLIYTRLRRFRLSPGVAALASLALVIFNVLIIPILALWFLYRLIAPPSRPGIDPKATLFCVKCGESVASHQANCPHCGNSIPVQ
ncbi:hypothetical protein EB093_00425 [bacterium]|nr:hypothetical protein [bacterium]